LTVVVIIIINNNKNGKIVVRNGRVDNENREKH